MQKGGDGFFEDGAGGFVPVVYSGVITAASSSPRVRRQLREINMEASDLFEPTDLFVDRHIGPSDEDIQEMLETLGFDTLDELVATLAKALGIEKPHKVAQGSEKTQIKPQIRALKVKRDEAAAGKDKEAFRASRHEIHKLRRHLRRMAKLTG